MVKNIKFFLFFLFSILKIKSIIFLLVLRDIYLQHKTQISEQLNEVHNLMSIQSDDDLLSHLQ